jgi:integrase
MVSWRLWDATKELLDKHKSNSPTWLLVNENGSQIVTSKIRKDGRVAITSNVKSAWDRLTSKMKKKGVIVRPLEQLRKTGSSKLEQHVNYGRYSQFFLGQAPSSVSEKRYAPPSQDVFDQAMQWLGEQFNL